MSRDTGRGRDDDTKGRHRRRNEGPLSVVVCDDHQLLTDALHMTLGAAAEVELAEESVSTGEEAVKLCERLRPDVCVMDLHLGAGLDGIEATRRIRTASPMTKVIMLSADTREELAIDALEAGAAAFIRKSELLVEVASAIVTVGHGGSVLDPNELTGLIQRTSRARSNRADVRRRLDRLTPREREILGMLADGKSNTKISRELFISRRTVDTHIQNILRKLDLHSRLEAATFASRHLAAVG